VTSAGFRKTAERLLHDGYIISLFEAEFEGPAGERITRDVVRHPGAVAVVAIDRDEVVLVRQFRAALEAEMLELPAGKLDVPGEPLEVAARRELVEEAGLDAPHLEVLATFHNSGGFCDEVTTIFLATELVEATAEAFSVEEQYLTVERVHLDEVGALIAEGGITDAKTVIGLLAALRLLGR
jgi:ADP-ribose pyrophosphatase|tara:strand:+ start:2364 stop:2909 length:546 start_codon:yes stop_codon:yes gene_type:complete